MRVAVLPWGDPSRWRYVEYCLQGDPERCAAGFSTLELLFKLEELRPDLALVFAPDTLALATGVAPEVRGYGALVERARSHVERYLCVGEAERGRVRVVVLPGVMSDPGAEFRANLGDTRLLALHEAYGSFVDAAGRGGGALEVLLDTTHGVNYFTIAVREAVFEAAAAAAATLGGEVRVSVYNADPVVPPRELERSPGDPCRPVGRAQPPRVAYNLVYEELVRPWDLARYARYREGRHGKPLSDPRGCGLDEEDRRAAVSFAKHVVSSFRVGALLELAELAAGKEQVGGLSKVLDKARECWASKAGVRLEGGRLRTSFVRLEDGFRLLLHARAIASGVRKVLGEARDGVSLDELKRLRDALLSGSEVTGALLNKELGDMERMLKESSEKIPSEWTSYSMVLGKEVELSCEERDADDRLKRNFVAHVGLLGDLVELRRAGEPGRPGLLLRVRPGCWPPSLPRISTSLAAHLLGLSLVPST